MKSNDGYELPGNSDIWVAIKRDSKYVPEKYNMYSSIANGRYWYYKEESCQKYCDNLNINLLNSK